MNYLNLCTECKEDFASVSAFDKHRVGKRAYTYSQRLAKNPPKEDGRRCLDKSEMLSNGFEVDKRGRWRLAADAARLREAFRDARETSV